jgi:hypothetical protein
MGRRAQLLSEVCELLRLSYCAYALFMAMIPTKIYAEMEGSWLC